jgi:hypothetical protein
MFRQCLHWCAFSWQCLHTPCLSVTCRLHRGLGPSYKPSPRRTVSPNLGNETMKYSKWRDVTRQALVHYVVDGVASTVHYVVDDVKSII